MTTNELKLAKNVVKVIDPTFQIDKDTTWVRLVISLHSFYDGKVPADISLALNYFAIDENRKNWKEFITYLDYSIYNKKMEQESEKE